MLSEFQTLIAGVVGFTGVFWRTMARAKQRRSELGYAATRPGEKMLVSLDQTHRDRHGWAATCDQGHQRCARVQVDNVGQPLMIVAISLVSRQQ